MDWKRGVDRIVKDAHSGAWPGAPCEAEAMGEGTWRSRFRGQPEEFISQLVESGCQEMSNGKRG